ncbi:hypothetical protein EQG68_14755 [Flavobacterium piscinae]|uniref:RHS repeat-associated core domain-containing protein n=2 Tax=Flavobacterium piscinae TaxID=2506424 RepID=A0A4Q1KF44_9FLAO|nr:hypothetical protein [Flavobacterium piscinae]RXR27619.1 hypothetical protein EQG68_14755 [Flavobacterium piscinae]
MLIPNRFDSLDDYRYGFQGQEKDDEVKGEGNSLNYTFRMHDPRVGRFFALDPLFFKFPELSPYQFSHNRAIDFVEIEGLEGTGFDVRFRQREKALLSGKMSEDDFRAANRAEAIGGIFGAVIVADAILTKGKVTKFLGKQFVLQAVVNTGVEGFITLLNKNHKFDAKNIVKTTIGGFDFADAGIDKGLNIVLDKYQIGKIKSAIIAVAPSLFDLTLKDGLQVVGFNKDAKAIITDIVGNVMTEGIEKSLNLKDIPKIKLSASTQAQIIGESIMAEIENYLKNDYGKFDKNEIDVK